MIGKLVFCGLLALAAALPSPTERKCQPAQWEALQVGRVAQIYKNQPQVMGMVANRSNDFTNKMMAVHEVFSIEVKGQPDLLFYNSLVIDYNKMMKYEYRPASKTCKKIKVTEKMSLFCSDSKAAKLSHSFVLDGRMVDLYDTEIAEANTKSHISVFRDSFSPVSEVIEREYGGIPQMIALQYGNVTTGIKDMDVFKIPSYCT